MHHSIVISAPLEKVREFVSETGLGAWWAEDVRRVDGAVELGFFDRSTAYRLRPEPLADGAAWRCESGQEWAGTRLVFRFSPRDGGTQVDFAHADWAAVTPYFVSCNTVWGHLMFRLKEVAEGGRARPLFTTSGMDG